MARTPILSGLARLLVGNSSLTVPNIKPTQEMGVSGTAVYGGYIRTVERSPRWVGQERYRTISDIVTNVSIVAASVHYFLNLIAHPNWSVKPADGAGAQKYADFVESCMNDLTMPWSRVVRRAGNYRFYGFGIQEWTAKKRTDGQIGYMSVEPRPQHTIWRWAVEDNGSVSGVFQRSPQTGQEIGLPRGKLIYIVDDTLSDSPEGLGIFRHLAEPYERLKTYLRLEAQGFERDLRGTPLGRAPLSVMQDKVKAGKMKPEDYKAAVQGIEDFLKLQQTSPETGFLMDSMPYESQAVDGLKIASVPQWDLSLLQGAGKGLVELAAAIDRIQREMARIMGTEQLMLGDMGGNRALSQDKSRNLYLVANAVLANIASAMTADFISPLWTLNGFPEEMKPSFKTEDVTFKDVSEVTASLRDMATAGAMLAPDDEAINDVRDLLGIAHAPKPTPEMMGAVQKPPAPSPDNQPNVDGEVDTTDESDPNQPPGRMKKAYNPSEPRDERGRWSSAGGGGAILSQNWTGRTKSQTEKWLNEKKQIQSIIHHAHEWAVHTAVEISHHAISTATVDTLLEHVAPAIHGMEHLGLAASAGVAIVTIMKKLGFTPEKSHSLLVHVVKGLIGQRKAQLAGVHKADASDDPVLAALTQFLMALQNLDLDKIEKFNPDQPRDQRGRWTNVGGGATANLLNYTPQPARNATELFNRTLDKSVTPEDVVNAVPGAADKVAEAERIIAEGEPTNLANQVNGQYTPAREALHQQILEQVFNPDAVKAAIPENGQPTLVVLGGRGGSGKSWFTNSPDSPIDPSNYLTIDSDAIKAMLPEYNGANAALVHEEASDIVSRAFDVAKQAGLNVIYDATLRSTGTVSRLVNEYKAAGYNVEGYYMHAAPQVAAVRATQRFVKSGRYVPPSYVLSSTTNERMFDSMTPQFSKWAVYDNNTGKPKLAVQSR